MHRITEQLLNDQSYHIEFNGHLTNHAKHAVVALAGLGAPIQRISDYYHNYSKLTPYGFALEKPKISRQIINEENWKNYLGKRIYYSSYCDFFDQKEREIGTTALLQRYLPTLLPGWTGAFTHATIHLGWGLHVNSRQMILEGLAYMAFSYVSCHPERASRIHNDVLFNAESFSSLFTIADYWEKNHSELHHLVEGYIADAPARLAIHPELARSGLQYRITRMLDEGHPLIYGIPSWIDSQEIHKSWEQLYYLTTLIYMTSPGDFINLHLITSLFAMEQISKHLSHEQAKESLKLYWIGMLGILFSRAEFPNTSKLETLHQKYTGAFDINDPATEGEKWESIIGRAILEEEEHNPKLVYALRQIWRKYEHQSIYRIAASHFTTTPILPKTFEEPPHE